MLFQRSRQTTVIAGLRPASSVARPCQEGLWGIAKYVAWIVAALVIAVCPARANVVYDWQTLSATLHGSPTSLTAAGEITLTDVGFSQGVVGVTTPNAGPITHTLNGMVSASFEMFSGPALTLSNSLVNFTATVNGQFLDVSPVNLFGGFFVNLGGGDAYFAITGPGPDELTIGFGSENPASACFGSQIPGQSACIVTGVFERVPEPGTLTMLLSALVGLGWLTRHRRGVKKTSGQLLSSL